MLDLVLIRQQPKTAGNLLLRSRLQWFIWYMAVLGLAGLVGLLMYRSKPDFSWIAWLFFILTTALTLYRPRIGIYLTVFWTVMGDHSLMPWFPFTKNFSSREALLFLNDAVIFSPLELLLVITSVSWLFHDAMQRKLRLYRGPLFWPALLFAGFIAFGLAYGIVRGGSVNVALWESRAIFYMLLLIVLVSNLFEKKAHLKLTIGALIAGLLVKSLYASYHLLFVLKGSLAGIDSLTDHQAAIHVCIVVVLAAAFWLFRVGWRNQLLILCLMPPILLTIMAAQRRSAFIALLVALAMMAVILFLERRRDFWLIVPPVAFIALAYMGLFWNSSHPLGGPAQAVKSVVAEDQAEFHDRASNDYRKIENYNSTFTIKQEPLTGVGFGNKFYIVIPMPDISGFTWWEYVPHNSIIYIWIKSGVGGFIGLLLFIGLSIAHGVRAAIRLTEPSMRAIALTGTLYIIMHFIYAYVDISWEAQGMVVLGIMLGILNIIEPIVTVDVTAAKQRWPWQKKSIPADPLLPLPAI